MLDFPGGHFTLARTADVRISEKRNRNPLGAVARGVFRERAARHGISHRRGPGKQRRRSVGGHSTKNGVPDDESLSLRGRSFDGCALSENGGAIVVRRE